MIVVVRVDRMRGVIESIGGIVREGEKDEVSR